MVGRWERGEREPRSPYPKLLAALYETDAYDLGLKRSPQEPACDKLEDDMERRTLLRLLAGALGGPMLGGDTASAAERLAGALSHPSRTDQAAVGVIEASIANARRLDDLFGSRVAVKPALAQREILQTLLKGAVSDTARLPLAAAAAELSQFLGWLAFDMNDHTTARAYINEGLRAAHEAGAHVVGAYLLGWLSILSNYEDKPLQALAFAQAAWGRVEGAESARTQSWVAAVEAEAFANLQDRAGTEKSLDRARATFAMTRPENEPPWIYHYDQSGLQSDVGTCYLRLGLAEPARQAIEQALAASDASVVRERAVYLARLAATYLPDGEIEEVCRLAGEALTVATSTNSDRAAQRVRELRGELAPWTAETMVRELDDRIASTQSWFQPVVA
jgi:tetratricopeptide (TPR) repeat protein